MDSQIYLKVRQEGKVLMEYSSIIDHSYDCRFFGDTKPTLVSNDYSTIVVFIVGGITTQEIQLVQEYSQQIKKQVRKANIRSQIEFHSRFQ